MKNLNIRPIKLTTAQFAQLHGINKQNDGRCKIPLPGIPIEIRCPIDNGRKKRHKKCRINWHQQYGGEAIY